VVCAAVMVVATWGLRVAAWDGMTQGNIAVEIAVLALVIMASSLAYGGALHVTGVMRWRELVAIMRKQPLE
jgi:hypothetical protein